VAKGRHARGAEHPTAHLDPGPQAEVPVQTPDTPVPTGRRRRVAEVSTTPVLTEVPRAGVQETEQHVSGGTGHRRRTEPEPEQVLPAPTRRRRRLIDESVAERIAEPVVEPVVEPIAAPAPGTGRRRRAAEVPSSPVIELVVEAPVLAVHEAVTPAPVTELAPRAHRRAAPARKAAPRTAGGHAARTSGGHAGTRRKAATLPTPNGTALIAGAAAVAVAAVGAIGAANSGSDAGTTAASMAGASALGLPDAAALADSPSVNREQVRASRERARDALADRVAAAAALEKKQEAAARALAAAKARAAQLVKIAKNYSLPVSGYRLTAGFGEGGYRWSSSHTGLDFACAYGSPIRAVAAGTVISAGYDGAYGWKTVIRHADGTESWYAHQSQILVRRGQVAAGQIIGRVGMTGNTSGPHLHLEIRINDNPVNPLTWLRGKGLRV
jgi:murein DD-endopeptidase MepM/ murein hydrolase activator NlpD